ncbi:MAG: ral secretion pathway protein [Clostridiales bacterium]|nr:ral secretion pathway protein [Clostridiales bacterium]MDN5282968.1 ral secretion pathway protein [Candidatus Ozemobacter sp.]
MKKIDKSAFTILELLVVITILAVLAGAAVPYAMRYIEDTRISKTKADLDQIRNAIIRWELDRSPWEDADTTVAGLVGPYLTKAPIDPWGSAYAISNQKSIVYSAGPDRVLGNADDISLNFRPRMAVARVQFKDNDGDGYQSEGDEILFNCTRPVATINDPASVLFVNTNGDTVAGTQVFGATPSVGTIFGSVVTIKITDPSTWPGSYHIQQGSKVTVSQIVGQEFLSDFSGEPTKWAKDDNKLIFK